MDVVTAGLFLATFIFLTYLWNLVWGLPAGLPPGPRWCRLPVVGTLPWIDEQQMHLQMRDWAKTYGGIFHIQMGNTLAVVLSDLNLIKEAFVREDCSGRPDTALVNYWSDNLKNGVLFSQGPSWKEHRRFTLSCLRDFGMGKFTLESRIIDEVNVVLDIFEHEDNVNGFEVHNHLMVGVSTIICSLVFGKHYTHDDAFLKQYLEILDEMAANMSNGAAAAFLPFLRILPGNVLTKFKRNSDWIRANWLDIELVEHKETVDVSNPRDYIDAYLAKMQTTKEGSTSRHPTTHMSDEQLVACLGDLFAAGTETTTNTLKWGLLYMLRYPDIQRKVQAELDEVVGRGRLPSIKDKPNLPYTHAAVLEMLRCSSVVPLGVLRATTKETTIGGYRIPNRTVLIPNLWAVTHDPRYWEKPDEFYPEHFLDADGKVTNREALIPFSSGTRLCIGELLARMELFLFFSSVLQRFTLAPPEGSPRPEAKGKLGITLSPQPYKLTATLR